MKLIDKIKDLFMDEVDVDDELEIEDELEEPKKEKEFPEKKEENVLPKVMRETIEKEDKLDLKREHKEEKPEAEPAKPKSFNFPIDFELEVPSRNRSNNLNTTIETRQKEEVPERKEFIHETKEVTPSRNINVLDFEKEATKKVSDLYSTSKELITEKPRFKATPVISPVYGILDKNYTKEEVRERDEVSSMMKRPSKKVDFETVRKKAFGNLADEIKDNLLCENCELYKEVKKISALKEDDLLYDMTVDDDEEPVTIEKAYDNYEEFGVAYEPKSERKPVVKEEPETEIVESVADATLETVNEIDESIEKLETRLDDIISKTHQIDDAVINDNNTDEEVEVLEKPDVVYEDKVEDEAVTPEEPVIPKRSSPKADTKVDDDFFELIDSMYKERSDE